MPLLPSELQGRSRRSTRGAGPGVAGKQKRKDTRRVARLVLANLALVALLYWMLFGRGDSTPGVTTRRVQPSRRYSTDGWMSRKEMLDRARPTGAMDLAENAWNTAQEDIRAVESMLTRSGQNLRRVRKDRHLGDGDEDGGRVGSAGEEDAQGPARGLRRG